MSEQLHRNNTYESQALQTPEVYDAPQMATEDEIRIAKTAAAAEESAREEARQPLIDEARAAVEAAMADMNQQPVLGRKQKLRQFAGLNAYSKKETRRMQQESAARQDQFWQAEAAYQHTLNEDSNQKWNAKLAAFEQDLDRGRTDVAGSEGAGTREPAKDEALAAAEASIAMHADKKSERSGRRYEHPPQAEALARAMGHEGIGFRYTTFSTDGELGEAYDGIFTLDHDKRTNQEPVVRIYRGVREVNGTVLNQSPPVLKGLDKLFMPHGSPREQEAVRRRKEETKTKIFTFMENPTLGNLKDYVDSLAYEAGFKSPQKRERLNEQMKRIETAVTEKGISVEDALREEHILSFSGGDNLQIDISPYIAASPDPEAAGFYADGALLAIDVPASKIAGYGEHGEILIKGELTSENIAGVAARRPNKTGLKQHASPSAHKQAMSNLH